MNLKKMINFIVAVCMALFFCCSMASFAHAVDQKIEKASSAVAKEETSSKIIDVSNPQEVLDPGTYVQYLKIGKEWLITHGPGILVALVILVVGRWLALWFAAIVKRAMMRGDVEETLSRFLGKLIYYSLLTAVVIAAADQAGINTTSFLAIMGAAGLAVGLALKDSLANFASGVMLILFRPFKVDDAVTVGGVTGTVRQIDIFSTIILTFDNQKFIIPNSSITSGVINNINAEPTRRIDLVVGIGYDDDIRLAKTTLEELVQDDDRILDDPAPTIAVSELGASSVNLVVRPWVNTPDYWNVRLDLTEKIKLTFDEKGISIPYPQQDVHMHQKTAA